jgi:hypothetical protein
MDEIQNLVSNPFADDRNQRHPANAREQASGDSENVVAFPLHECLCETVNIARHQHGQGHPKVQGHEAEEKNRKSKVADVVACAPGTNRELPALPEEGTLWHPVTSTKLKLIFRHKHSARKAKVFGLQQQTYHSI